MDFKELANRARLGKRKRLVVVGAHETKLLKAVERARVEGIAEGILLGDRRKIEEIAARENIQLDGHAVENIPTLVACAKRAMELVGRGEVDALMKGIITTQELMHVALKSGLRHQGRLLTHVAAFEHPRIGEGRLLMLSDAGLVPYPTLEKRVEIIKNSVNAMGSIGVAEPKVAILSSTEDVDANIPVSLDAVKLKEMNQPGGALEGFGVIDGPLDFFSAIDKDMAALKGIEGPVAGRADILHSPDVVAGNLLSKAIIYFAEGILTGGCVVGGTIPLILLSRASSADDKFCSILLGLSCSQF